jgi:hypothetical protein
VWALEICREKRQRVQILLDRAENVRARRGIEETTPGSRKNREEDFELESECGSFYRKWFASWWKVASWREQLRFC